MYKCEKTLLKTKKQKKANCMLESTKKIAKKRREAKIKKDKHFRRKFHKAFQK